MEQNENTLSVLKIAPGQYPQQVEIDNDLKTLQQAVGGSIGASYPFEDAEFAELLTKKKAAYPDYRKARNEMQELVRAQKNVERFFAEEKPAQENEQAR